MLNMYVAGRAKDDKKISIPSRHASQKQLYLYSTQIAKIQSYLLSIDSNL